MTNEPAAPSLPKWPFLIGDLLLLALAWWIVSRSPEPFALAPLLSMVGCVFSGAWIAVLPFLAEHKGQMKLAESHSLHSVARQINDLKSIGSQVAGATSQWQDVHEKAGHAVSAASEIAQRMAAETKAFTEFMEKADQSEKAHLRLEVDKLRRTERDWVQVLMTVLDHVYALRMAAVRSAKRPLIQQLTHFQHACRESARRIGLIPFEVEPGAAFDPEQHFRPEEEEAPPPGATVSDTLASGYSYQGRLLRKPLVQLTVVQDTGQPGPPAPQEEDLFHPPNSTRPETEEMSDVSPSETVPPGPL